MHKHLYYLESTGENSNNNNIAFYLFQKQHFRQEETGRPITADPDLRGDGPGGHCLPFVRHAAALRGALTRRQRPSRVVCPVFGHRRQWTAHAEPHGCAGSLHAAGELAK